MQIANLFFAAIFLLCVAVQYNDPDPARWMAIYGGAAIASIQAAGRRLPWWFSACVGLIAMIWAISLGSSLLGKTISFRDVFSTIEMKNDTVEIARETGGLVIVAAWMAIISIHRLRSRRRLTVPLVTD